MRFEELAYPVDGSPATVRFNAGLTVMSLAEDERTAWVARLLGVLEGTRAGDSTRAVYTDRRGRRIGLDRDDQGGASMIDLATGAEVPYSAGHLPLDGRFDWFASNGLTSRAASDLVVVDCEAFTGGQRYDRQELEAKLNKARKGLSRVESQHKAAIARWRRRDELRGQISDLDEQVAREEADREHRQAGAEVMRPAAGAAEDWWRAMAAVDDARRAFGSRPRLDPPSLVRALARPTEIGDDLESLAKACRAMAERRDELVALLDAGVAVEVDERAAEMRRELIEEVEPAYVDALARLAGACRPFGVTIDAARIEAAGIGAAGIETLGTEVLAEVAAQVNEAGDAHLQHALEEVESECRAARERLEQHLAGLGLPTGGTGDLAAGAEAVAARAAEAADDSTARDTGRTMAERARLVQALDRAERNLPDVAKLADRHSALERQVAEMEASFHAGRPLVSAEEAEMILDRRAAEAGRNDRRHEPLPLVLNDPLAPFATTDKTHLFDALARLTETTQIIYLTGDPDTLSWASSQSAQGDLTLWRPDDVATVA
jgi:hypothetical protein